MFHNFSIPTSQPLGQKVKSLGDLLDAQDGQQWSSDSGPRRSSLADGNPSSTSKVNSYNISLQITTQLFCDILQNYI